MTMVAWFGLAALALILSVTLWWAEGLQREIDRLYEKNVRLERERDEEIEYAHRAFRNFSPEDPATVLDFPEDRRVR